MNVLFHLISVLLLTSTVAVACCLGPELNYYPKTEKIAQNPVFLLEYPGIKPLLKRCNDLYLIDQKGNITNLVVVEGYGKQNFENNKSYHDHDYQNRFVLLKPEKRLKRNTEVSIFIATSCIEDLNTKKRMNDFLQKTWIVKYKVDKIAPYFKSEVNGQYSSYGSGQNIQFNFKVDDNNTYWTTLPLYYPDKLKQKFVPQKELLIELTDLKGIKHIFPMLDGSFRFFNGMCYSNFALPNSFINNSMDFAFTAKLMDYSGNKSVESKSIRFRIVQRSAEKRVVRHADGVKHTIRELSLGGSSLRGPEELTIKNTIWKNVSRREITALFDVYMETIALDDSQKDD